MNTAESNATERLLIGRGWSAAEEAKDADMVILNTCSVRQTAENRVRGRLGYYTALKRNKPLVLAVMGCMAERIGEELKRDYPIDFVVSNFGKQHFPFIAEAVEKGCEGEYSSECRSASFTDKDTYFPPVSSVLSSLTANHLPLTTSSYVPIMHGCNNFCAYCIVPYVRGREVSRPANEILTEIDTLINAGVKEITLLGQNVNSYRDKDTDFATLLRLISSLITNRYQPTTNHYPLSTNHYLPWVRFMSSHPKDLTELVISAIAQCPVICHHIHLPVQSGSDRILKAMNRRYTRAEYLEKVARIRKEIEGVSLTTDIMVGFPGETEEDFEEILSLMEEVRYENAFMYYYNVREGTPAAKMEGGLSTEVKKARLSRVINRQLEITKEVMAKRVGSIVTALVESVSRDDKGEMLCRTERDERVAVGGLKGEGCIGQFIKVRLTSLNGHTYKGELI